LLVLAADSISIHAMRTWLVIGLLFGSLFQLVPKQADKLQTNQHDGKHLSSPPPKPTGGTENLSVSGPSPVKKEDAANGKAHQPTWRERFFPPLLSNWPLVAVAIWGILVAIRTLNAIKEQTKATRIAAEASEKSVNLQATALRQWVDIKEWRSTVWIPEGGVLSLHIQFDVVNPTSLPLTLDSVFIMLGDQGGKVGRRNLVPPGKGHPVVTSVKITEEQLRKWDEDELVFIVNGHVDFGDVLENVRSQPFSGLIACSKKRGVKFIPPYGPGLYITDEKKDENPN
jgi:hypothetical protein